MRSRPSSLLLLLLAACGDDVVATPGPAPLAEVCGQPGPLRLLPLAPDERAGAAPRSFAVVGDRLLFVVGEGERFVSPGFGPVPETTTVYAVGRCGEQPVAVAHDIETVFVEPRWPNLALGCTLADRDLVRLDLSGTNEPVVLAPGACTATFTDHGLLLYTDHQGGSSAAFFPLDDPEAPSFGAPIEVAPPVPILNSLSGSIRLLPDEVLLVEASGDLVRVGLPDLERTVLRSGVTSLAASDDGRHILYQFGPGTGDDPHNPVGEIQLLDRETGASTPIGTGTLSTCYPCFPAPGVARVDLTSPDTHQRLVDLTDFSFSDAPVDHELVTRLDDGRWIARTGTYGPWYLDDPAAGSSHLITDRDGRMRAHTNDHLDLVLHAGNAAPQTDAPLVRYFFTDKAPQTLAAHVGDAAFIRADGRILTTSAVDEAWLGELLLVDPATADTTRVDDHVVAGTDLDHWRHPDIADSVLYAVVDGERTGVWLARPAPSE